MKLDIETKKLIVPTLIAVIMLITFTAGATYAYYSVITTNDFSSTAISTSLDSIGNVALQEGANLTLNLSASNTLKQANDVTYYASDSGITTTVTTEVLATATVVGVGTYNCNYTITVTPSATNSMYTAFYNMVGKSSGQIVLKIDNTIYDFYVTDFSTSFDHSGTFTGITSSSSDAARQVNAQFYIVNKYNVNQEDLAGTDITLTFSVNTFTCSMV